MLYEVITIKRPLVLIDRTALSLQLVYDAQESQISVFSRVNERMISDGFAYALTRYPFDRNNFV